MPATAVALLATAPLAMSIPAPLRHFADAADAGRVVAGRRLYAQRCATCHGRALQGQPLWQLSERDGLRRAPALDQTGPAWQRSDEALFRWVSEGHAAGPDPEAGADAAETPDAGAMVDAAQALAVLAFIKARWPLPQRIIQAGHNPGAAGMPKAAAADWRFDPTCGPNAVP